MPGTAVVTINDNQWSVNVANTTTELIQGLSGVASIPVGTGMLFILPSAQVVTVNTFQMLFPIDIIFIKDNAILSIAGNIQPGYEVSEATPCDSFLEVNAYEAALVEVGDEVVLTDYVTTTNGFDFGSLITSILPLLVLAFVFPMLTGMTKGVTGSSPKHPRELMVEEHHSIHGEPRQRLVERYGSWAVGRAEAICPEDDVACVTREAKRLIETLRSRHGEEAMTYIRITNSGKSIFHVGDTISLVAFKRENKRLRDIGEKEAVGEVTVRSSSPANYLSYSEMVSKLGERLNTDEGVEELRKEMEKAPHSIQGVYWHFTPTERLSSIKSNGLMVGSPMTHIGKQRRNVIYLAPDKWSCILLAVSSVDMRIYDPGNYAILSIRLPTAIKLCKDPWSQAFFGGLYVKENILPEYITVDEIINIPEESEWLGYI